jgi:trehalose 6-phosphate phosphatase
MQNIPFFINQHALFLDFDGTLVDIAPTPNTVQRPAGMPQLLRHLQSLLGGAMAIVTGRHITDIDHLLSPIVLPVAGEHGAQRRDNDGHWHHTDLSCSSAQLAYMLRAASLLADQYSALWLEPKDAGFALHYRSAPALAQLCWDALEPLMERIPDWSLVRGKYGLEMRPSAVDKGTALTSFMQENAFAGRVPVFVGDDAADEDGFHAAAQAGGYGIKVGDGPSAARYRWEHPAAVHTWLQHIAAQAPIFTQPQLPPLPQLPHMARTG